LKEKTSKLLLKAQNSIEAADILLKAGMNFVAIGRAYYAMFYIAEALLYEEGFEFSKHSGVHGAFGQHFAKPGKLDAKYHRWMIDSFDERLGADYGVDIDLEVEEVQKRVEHARQFLQAAQEYLKK